MENKGARIVHCLKLGRMAPGLEQPPFEGAVGQEIFEHVSAEAWNAWADDMMIKVINEYRLNLGDEKDYNVLIDQMRAFLNLQKGVSVLEVENAARGRGED